IGGETVVATTVPRQSGVVATTARGALGVASRIAVRVVGVGVPGRRIQLAEPDKLHGDALGQVEANEVRDDLTMTPLLTVRSGERPLRYAPRDPHRVSAVEAQRGTARQTPPADDVD